LRGNAHIFAKKLINMLQISRRFTQKSNGLFGFMHSNRFLSSVSAQVDSNAVEETVTQKLGRKESKEKFYEIRLNSVNIHAAVDLVKKYSWAKFDETMEIAVHTGLDPRKPNQTVKGIATLPYGTGKTVRVCVIASGNDAKEALDAGAEVVGAEDVIKAIQGGNINFDTVIATPEMMSLIGKIGKVNTLSLLLQFSLFINKG
jgi:5-methylcytosine-specific restriction endonuclease McrBC GTP-binding regulatory subunit McrB